MPALAELVCADCGRKSYHPIGEKVPPCAECGGEQQVVDTIRDRRRVNAPVKRDRRISSTEFPTID
jgi:ribosomal protein L37E